MTEEQIFYRREQINIYIHYHYLNPSYPASFTDCSKFIRMCERDWWGFYPKYQ